MTPSAITQQFPTFEGRTVTTTHTRPRQARTSSVLDQPRSRPLRQSRVLRAGEFLIGRASYGLSRPDPRRGHGTSGST